MARNHGGLAAADALSHDYHAPPGCLEANLGTLRIPIKVVRDQRHLHIGQEWRPSLPRGSMQSRYTARHRPLCHLQNPDQVVKDARTSSDWAAIMLFCASRDALAQPSFELPHLQGEKLSA